MPDEESGTEFERNDTLEYVEAEAEAEEEMPALPPAKESGDRDEYEDIILALTD